MFSNLAGLDSSFQITHEFCWNFIPLYLTENSAIFLILSLSEGKKTIFCGVCLFLTRKQCNWAFIRNWFDVLACISFTCLQTTTNKIVASCPSMVQNCSHSNLHWCYHEHIPFKWTTHAAITFFQWKKVPQLFLFLVWGKWVLKIQKCDVLLFVVCLGGPWQIHVKMKCHHATEVKPHDIPKHLVRHIANVLPNVCRFAKFSCDSWLLRHIHDNVVVTHGNFGQGLSEYLSLAAS